MAFLFLLRLGLGGYRKNEDIHSLLKALLLGLTKISFNSGELHGRRAPNPKNLFVGRRSALAGISCGLLDYKRVGCLRSGSGVPGFLRSKVLGFRVSG